MNKGSTPRNKSPAPAGAAGQAEEMEFVVELWDMARVRCERVIGRAESFDVATAIYTAVAQELPFRLVLLRRGSKVLRTTD